MGFENMTTRILIKIGGRAFEPDEENPMIGFRGASRYYNPRYQAAFELECRAMRKVRDEMGLRNLKLMVPFCRTVEEGRRVLADVAPGDIRRALPTEPPIAPEPLDRVLADLEDIVLPGVTKVKVRSSAGSCRTVWFREVMSIWTAVTSAESEGVGSSRA